MSNLFLVKDNVLGECVVRAEDEVAAVRLVMKRLGESASDVREINVRWLCDEGNVIGKARRAR